MIARERRPEFELTPASRGTERAPLTSVPTSRPGTSPIPPQEEGWSLIERLRWVLNEALEKESAAPPHLADLADRLDGGLSQSIGRVPGGVVWMRPRGDSITQIVPAPGVDTTSVEVERTDGDDDQGQRPDVPLS